MNKWFLSTEVFSLILIAILVLNYHDKRWTKYPRSRIYNLCLMTSISSVLLNILCVFTIAYAREIPLWINLTCNSLYFLTTLTVSAIISYYLTCMIFLHVQPGGREQRFCNFVLVVLYLFYLLFIIYNLKSGCIFYFDENHLYQRGPLINLGYVILGIEILILVACAFRHRHSLDLSMKRVMQVLPPTVFFLALYQIMFPQVLFNGGIIATANILILINFQARRIEQDALTSCGNRNSFHQELLLRLSERRCFQVIALSVLQLKHVNRRFDYPSGDSLLCEIALWLSKLRKDGQLFRIGNTKFALIIPCAETEINNLPEIISQRFHRPWDVNGMKVYTRVSVVEFLCTDWSRSATDIADLLNFSLSIAHQYKDHLVRFSNEIWQKMDQQLQIVRQMQPALKNQLFEVWYQPIYNCKSGQFTAAEALVRMRDQNHQLISPAVFIPLAEQHGLIDDISDLVLDHTCHLLSMDVASGLDYISVNISMQQFISDDLTDKIRTAMERYPSAAGHLNLEITEHVLTDDMERMYSVVSALSQMGIRFSLDDFGTGYSNLSITLECPLSYIKLDRSLIQDMDRKRSAAIVKSMLHLFHDMNFKVVAEGVETEAQADALRQEGTDMIQGYYYARPMPEEEFIRFISSGQAPVQ